ncbi:MAG: hypothetical protein ACPGUF_06465, partial [Litorivicinus sp.]
GLDFDIDLGGLGSQTVTDAGFVLTATIEADAFVGDAEPVITQAASSSAQYLLSLPTNQNGVDYTVKYLAESFDQLASDTAFQFLFNDAEGELRQTLAQAETQFFERWLRAAGTADNPLVSLLKSEVETDSGLQAFFDADLPVLTQTLEDGSTKSRSLMDLLAADEAVVSLDQLPDAITELLDELHAITAAQTPEDPYQFDSLVARLDTMVQSASITASWLGQRPSGIEAEAADPEAPAITAVSGQNASTAKNLRETDALEFDLGLVTTITQDGASVTKTPAAGDHVQIIVKTPSGQNVIYDNDPGTDVGMLLTQGDIDAGTYRVTLPPAILSTLGVGSADPAGLAGGSWLSGLYDVTARIVYDDGTTSADAKTQFRVVNVEQVDSADFDHRTDDASGVVDEVRYRLSLPDLIRVTQEVAGEDVGDLFGLQQLMGYDGNGSAPLTITKSTANYVQLFAALDLKLDFGVKRNGAQYESFFELSRVSGDLEARGVDAGGVL